MLHKLIKFLKKKYAINGISPEVRFHFSENKISSVDEDIIRNNFSEMTENQKLRKYYEKANMPSHYPKWLNEPLG